MDLNQRPPWSSNALGRLGKALRDGIEPPVNCPSYNDVMLWHSDLAAEVHEQIENGNWVVSTELRATAARRIGAELLVSSRPKTIDTLIDKLQRRPNQQLNTVQDLAGVRIDADMVLSEQSALAREIAAHFGADEAEDIHDLRSGKHAGYRGVHVWLKLPAGRVEVQIRTLLQSLWANMFEKLADTYGREIRYGEPLNEALDGTDVAEVQRMVGVALDGSRQMAAVEADWQAIQDIEDPHKRAWEFSKVATMKAFYFAGVALVAQGKISGAEFSSFFARHSGQGGGE